jgi:hypothetical protein
MQFSEIRFFQKSTESALVYFQKKSFNLFQSFSDPTKKSSSKSLQWIQRNKFLKNVCLIFQNFQIFLFCLIWNYSRDFRGLSKKFENWWINTKSPIWTLSAESHFLFCLIWDYKTSRDFRGRSKKIWKLED